LFCYIFSMFFIYILYLTIALVLQSKNNFILLDDTTCRHN
jgi:hypothetical protein